MEKIRSFDELKRMYIEKKSMVAAKSDKSHPDSILQIKVTMATCGIASGSKPVFEFFKAELEKRSIPALVTKTGCMSYCYAEPTIEVTIPGKVPVVFGYVDLKKADEIIERYIRKGEMVEGVIPVNYEMIENE